MESQMKWEMLMKLSNLFRKRRQRVPDQPSQQSGVSAGLPRQGDALPASLQAHSRFIKRVNCSQCGAPKSLPSKTAYMYCDYCGMLMDYDFRIANADTNAGITNTVYHRIIAQVQAPLAQARSRGDREACREIYRQVFTEWLQECPMAASPRAQKDMDFRDQMIAYKAECFLVKDFDPRQAPLDARMQQLAASLQRIPTPNGAWMVAGDFWSYAGLFKEQMELVYERIHELGVDAMDPDQAPPGVPLRMEFSTFCQAWLPHLSPADGERLLKLYGLDGEYDEFQPQQTDRRQCGSCGSEMQVLPGARQVVCESCGFTIDVGSEAVPCGKCGALLSFPISAKHLLCPYCQTDTRRV
jgi:LSD1 subclass zinc finger protein